MMKIKNEVSPKKVRQDAENYFRNGYYCCEAVLAAIRENIVPDIPQEVIAMTTGMAVGVGQSGCMCGALNGGIMALGMFFGRCEQNGPYDPKAIRCMQLTSELHNWFQKETGKNSVCCRVLIREFVVAQKDHSEQCIHFSGICAEKTAQIIVRELGLKNLDEE